MTEIQTMTLRDLTYCATAGQGLCANQDCSRWHPPYSEGLMLWAEFRSDDCGYVESAIWAALQDAVQPKSGNE
jgi:hypothetical protein